MEKLDKMTMQVGKDAIFVFLGLDNSIFYEADEDGERSLPSKDKEGKYHVVGKLKVTGGKTGWQPHGQLRPHLGGSGGQEESDPVASGVVLQMYSTCCEAREHCVNVGMAG